jgi:hypothetical protein
MRRHVLELFDVVHIGALTGKRDVPQVPEVLRPQLRLLEQDVEIRTDSGKAGRTAVVKLLEHLERKRDPVLNDNRRGGLRMR